MDSKLSDAEIIAVVLYTGPMVSPRPRKIENNSHYFSFIKLRTA
jgi:hypothetical protein